MLAEESGVQSRVSFSGWLSAAVGLAALTVVSSAQATTIILSDMSSDATPASQLDATFDFSNADINDQITLTVTNDTLGSLAEFNINEIYFNGPTVSQLDLVSATHSDAGDVTALWGGVGAVGGGQGSGMFGTFDFALTDGTGLNTPEQIGPGESIAFVFQTDGTNNMSDFAVQNAAGKFASAKFVNCRGSGCVDEDGVPGPGGFDDSAFGAQGDPSFVLPEPTTALLLGLGIAGLAASSRRRRE
jgi:hypothetical protein